MKLKAIDVSRQYFRNGKGTNVFTAVQQTDLTAEPGRLIAIEGRSGSGKSTLLNMLAGLLGPTTGKVLYDDTDIFALSDDERSMFRNQKIGVIPQGQTALRALTVLENVMLPARMYGDGADEARAMQLLEKVGISQLKDVYPDELSGGERRRLVIARALMMQPQVLLADEPTSDLDDENTRNILQLLRSCADEGMAVVLVTHETGADAYADEVYRMNDGKLLKEK